MAIIQSVINAAIDFYVGSPIQKCGFLSPGGTCEVIVDEKTAIVTLDTKGMRGTLSFQSDEFHFTYNAEANIVDQEVTRRVKK